MTRTTFRHPKRWRRRFLIIRSINQVSSIENVGGGCSESCRVGGVEEEWGDVPEVRSHFLSFFSIKTEKWKERFLDVADGL